MAVRDIASGERLRAMADAEAAVHMADRAVRQNIRFLHILCEYILVSFRAEAQNPWTDVQRYDQLFSIAAQKYGASKTFIVIQLFKFHTVLLRFG